MVKPVERMSESELVKAEARAAVKDRATCQALINAGFGNIRMSELREMDNPLARAHIAAWDARYVFIVEMESRKRWHGSLKPIKRSAP